jgi:hypothetical protein
MAERRKCAILGNQRFVTVHEILSDGTVDTNPLVYESIASEGRDNALRFAKEYAERNGYEIVKIDVPDKPVDQVLKFFNDNIGSISGNDSRSIMAELVLRASIAGLQVNDHFKKRLRQLVQNHVRNMTRKASSGFDGEDIAGQNMKLLKQRGAQIEIDPVKKTATLYHGTSPSAAKKIQRSGIIKGFPFFSEDMETAKKFGLAATSKGRPEVMRLNVYLGDILPTGGYWSSRSERLVLKGNVWRSK